MAFLCHFIICCYSLKVYFFTLLPSIFVLWLDISNVLDQFDFKSQIYNFNSTKRSSIKCQFICQTKILKQIFHFSIENVFNLNIKLNTCRTFMKIVNSKQTEKQVFAKKNKKINFFFFLIN